MLFNKSTLIASALCSLTSAAAVSHKRATVESQLYAYGTNLSGAPVFYGDGLAWIGYTVPDWISVAANVTFTASDSDTTTPWAATSNDTGFPDSPPIFYIVPTTDAFSQAGFVSSNDTSGAPDGAVTTGFTFFGTSVAYAASDSDFQLMFWAQETNTTDLWALMWNAGNLVEDDSVPVTLKTVAPLPISS